MKHIKKINYYPEKPGKISNLLKEQAEARKEDLKKALIELRSLFMMVIKKCS